tara:strand:+ start:1284 stop:1796 length:513 start_codon:yes stop_codon:yes gene_type:complete
MLIGLNNYMISVELKTKPRIKQWLRDNEIDATAVEICLNILLNQIRELSYHSQKYIEIKKYKNNGSGYYFGFDEVHITENLDQNGWSKEKKLDTFAGHFLHEIRHWMQDNMLGVEESKLNYTDEDCDNESYAYKYNRWEVDARRFERRYKKEFIDLYHTIEKLADKPDIA